MAQDRVERRLAAILVTDVVGYSRLMGADETGTLAQLRALRGELFEPKTAAFGGRIFKTTGDGALVEFPSAVDAVRCAVEIQRALAGRNADAPADRRIELRIGISLGDVVVEGEDLYGNGVNVAARMEGLAQPGGICVSANVHEQARGVVETGFHDLGPQPVKNIAEPVRCYRVLLDAGPAAPRDETAAILSRPAVAVLPFDNMSGDAEQEYFADGLTEDIITALTAWRSFPVIGRNSTFTFKGKAARTQDVGAALGARYVLEGSVRKAGTRVRVTAQLLDAETGHHLWAERYDRELADIFDIQDEITARIAATLVPELERAERDRAAAKAPASLDAWDCYLRGVAYHNELAPESIPKAREMFERAIALDPGYAKAHARLALTYHRELWLYVAADRAESMRLLLAAAERAVALDDVDAHSHWAMSVANFWPPAGDRDVAVREAARSLALNPADADANFTCGTSLMLSGRWEEAIPHIEAAIRLSPRDPRSPLFLVALAMSSLFAGHHEEATRVARECLNSTAARRMPEAIRRRARMALLAALGHMGAAEEAGAVLERMGAGAVQIGDATFEEFFLPIPPDGWELDYLVDGLRKAGVPE